MKNDEIDKFLLATMTIGKIYGTSYIDDFCFFNDKLLGYTVGLACEIDDLLEEGYTKEEIISFIMESDFTVNDSKLTKEEGEYLKGEALILVEIRYNLFNEQKTKNMIFVRK